VCSQHSQHLLRQKKALLFSILFKSFYIDKAFKLLQNEAYLSDLFSAVHLTERPLYFRFARFLLNLVRDFRLSKVNSASAAP